MNMNHNPQAGISDDDELFRAQEVLDSYEARLGKVTLAEYFAARQAVIVYIAHRVHENLDWSWSHPGAVEDILHALHRSLETKPHLQTAALTVDDLLQEMYLQSMPAANTMAA